MLFTTSYCYKPRAIATPNSAHTPNTPASPQGTVGAGLPVLSTLKSLLHTGDRVLSIEGVFSGTLSFILNALSPGSSPSNNASSERLRFSEAVRKARDEGYTEPDPREDLAGNLVWWG